MHCHDEKKKSLLQFLRKKHENFNIAVKKYNPTLDEVQLEGRESDVAKITTMDWC